MMEFTISEVHMPALSRGLYIWVVGPDGCGKSSLSRNLAAALDAQHVYWRPGVLPMAKTLVGRQQTDGSNSSPHSRQADAKPRALFRSAYYFADYMIGTYLKIRSANRNGKHYLIERGWGDMIIDPVRYGFNSSAWTRWYQWFLPTPDVICLITTPVEEIAQRKGELEDSEVVRQYDAWRREAHLGRWFIEHPNSAPLEESTRGLVRRIIDLSVSSSSDTSSGSVAGDEV